MSHGIAAALARRLILSSQKTQLGGSGGFSTEGFAARGERSEFPQADFERAHFDDFFTLFPNTPLRETIRDRVLLDLGSGYGGKTVEYAAQCGAARVCGIEPYPSMVDRSREYAISRHAANVEFSLCGPRDVPYDDATFDLVITHDVFEHVEDPHVTAAEIRRVLKPGGLSFNVFPLYLGALSHHLDYVVQLPGIHWLFSPHTLVRAVNQVLRENPKFGTAPQPEPRRSFDGRRYVLPSLNGLSGVHLEKVFEGFETVSLRRVGLGLRGLGLVANSRLPMTLRDMVTGTVVCVLRRPR